jgi:glucuronokinase
VRVRTSIPREVGLAGSSAIVIATLRALGALHAAPLREHALAHEALAAETEELGLAAGLQDRVAQAHGGLVLMDFSAAGAPPRVEALDPAALPELLVAWHPGAAAPSGHTHAGLRERAERDRAGVDAGMRRLAGHAHAARDAIVARDPAALAAAMDASFDERARLVGHAPAHLAMIAAVRDAGGAANSTGSGGAVVGVVPDPARRAAVLARLEALGCGTLRVPAEEAHR